MYVIHQFANVDQDNFRPYTGLPAPDAKELICQPSGLQQPTEIHKCNLSLAIQCQISIFKTQDEGVKP
jgi:hypothetical protein